MCHSAKDPRGPKRCFTHMHGTQATISVAQFITGLPRNFVNGVSKALKKEGKNLQQPTEEEITTFARSKGFEMRNGVNIPDKDRAKLIKQWQKAEQEKPDGGEFHAWRNTTVESVVRWKRTTMASVAGASILMTSACGIGGAPDENKSSSAPSSEVSTSAPASPTKSAEETKPAETKPAKPTEDKGKISDALKKDKVELTGKQAKNKNGSYQKIKLADDHPTSNYNPKTHKGDLPSGWTKSDAASAQKYAANFYVQEVIDSPVNGDASQFGSWSEKNVRNLDPDYAEDILQNAGTKETSFLPLSNYGDDNTEYKKIGYHFDQKSNSPRVSDMNLKVFETATVQKNYLSVHMNGNYSIKAVDKAGNKYQEKVEVRDYEIILKKSGNSFLISGIHTDTQATPIKK